MFISSHRGRRSRRESGLVVLTCAFLFIFLGAVQAQNPNYKAVGKRLRAAVAAGELTGQQARVMLGALKKAAAQHKAPAKQKSGEARAKVYLTRVKKELIDAVKAGKISKADAAKRYASAAQQMKKRMAAGERAKKASEGKKRKTSADPAREYLAKVRMKLGVAVRAGKMSREDAGKKYAAAEKSVKKKMALAKNKAKAKNKDKAKRAKGKKADVRAKKVRVKKAHAPKRDSLRQVEIDLANIQKALKSGKLSTRDAELKMRDMRRRLAAIQRASRQQGRRRL